MSIVYSRTFRLDGRRFLIPGIDLLNHHPTAHQAEWRLDDAAGCVHLVATAAITAGNKPHRESTSVSLSPTVARTQTMGASAFAASESNAQCVCVVCWMAAHVSAQADAAGSAVARSRLSSSKLPALPLLVL